MNEKMATFLSVVKKKTKSVIGEKNVKLPFSPLRNTRKIPYASKSKTK